LFFEVSVQQLLLGDANAGEALTGAAAGAWHFNPVMARDLLGERFIRTRVTAEGCQAPGANTIFFEGMVAPESIGRSPWLVSLRPSRAATAIRRARQTGTATLTRQPDGQTLVDITLDMVPVGFALTVCLRQQ